MAIIYTWALERVLPWRPVRACVRVCVCVHARHTNAS